MMTMMSIIVKVSNLWQLVLMTCWFTPILDEMPLLHQLLPRLWCNGGQSCLYWPAWCMPLYVPAHCCMPSLVLRACMGCPQGPGFSPIHAWLWAREFWAIGSSLGKEALYRVPRKKNQTLDEEVLCRVFYFWHSAESSLSSAFFPILGKNNLKITF